MAKVNHVSSQPIHPEGWYLFTIMREEEIESEFRGKRSLRYKWVTESRCKDGEGNALSLNVYTGREMLGDERCKLRQLTEACGIGPDDLEDTSELYGKVFAGRVTHGEGEKLGFANITAFDTKDRCRPVKGNMKKSTDPFEDE